MADILKKISELNKEKKPEDKSLLEELFPEATKRKDPPPEDLGITNLGTLGASNLKMSRDGNISGFQEIELGSTPAPAPAPAPTGADRDNMFGGMREFTLDALGSPPAPAPAVPLEAEGAGGPREFTLDALGAPARPELDSESETSFSAVAPPPDPLEGERKRFILLIAAMLKEGRYEAAINAVREMRSQLGKPGK